MKKHKFQNKYEVKTLQKTEPYMHGEDFVIKQDPMNSMNSEFNFEQLFVYHSPSGMGVGYMGSGASDCAASILLNYISAGTGYVTDAEERFIRNNYQEFKRLFIAPMHETGGFVTVSSIDDFINFQQDPPEDVDLNELAEELATYEN